jgi:hypothetical protein
MPNVHGKTSKSLVTSLWDWIYILLVIRLYIFFLLSRQKSSIVPPCRQDDKRFLYSSEYAYGNSKRPPLSMVLVSSQDKFQTTLRPIWTLLYV